MYRLTILVLVFSLILSGCAPASDYLEPGLQLRDKLLNANCCKFVAKIRASFDDAQYTFSLSCQADPKGTLTFSVISPEVIADISGVIEKGSGKLTFDDKLLAFPMLADGELSPISAPWVFYNAILSGYIRAAGQEEEFIRISIDDTLQGENLCVEVWFKEDTPVYAEVIWQGKNILSISISGFEIL